MICPYCQNNNAQDANFCLNCGRRLSIICPRCSRRVLSHANFCDGCGLALVDQSPVSSDMDDWQVPFAGEPPERRADNPAVNKPLPTAAAPIPDTEPSPGKVESGRAPDWSAQIRQDAVVPSSSNEAVPSSPLAQYIPRELMKKLEAARTSGSMVGERRVVTMLFCDVRGSTAMAQRLDPEEWSEIINGAFEHMIRPVYTYEGTVARLMGDGILAFFGAPLAHEDDPQRAVLAALDMQSAITPYRERIKVEWGIDIDLRVGINTGLVVVGSVGSDLRMEYSALGDAINLAARMEQTAEPGTVQIAHDTYRLVKPLFVFEELGAIEVKGQDMPVLAYRVLGRKAATGRVRGIEGLHAELVGREQELLTLTKVTEDLKQGVGRIVCVLGEAGMGKSRLILEARQYYDTLTGLDTEWHESTSLSYESQQAYALFQRLIRRMSGIGYDDAPRMIQKKIEALVKTLPEERQGRAGQLFEALFGLAVDNGSERLEGDAFKRELLETIDSWWRIRFAAKPTVLVFDDMHWSDAASIDMLRELLPLTGQLGLVIICAMRAERQAPSWQIRNQAEDDYHHRYTEINLGPLSYSESNELVNRLIAIPDIPQKLRDSILEKSDGNPFFIEEVVRALIDNGVVVPEDRVVDGVTRHYWVATSDGADFSIPDNLQSLLAARMDRLEEATRATLQLASVIGRSFYLRVLQAVDKSTPELDKHVATLMRMDMIRESARLPEIEYSFRNPLTQEAVYQTILLKRRREFHRRVGRAMEDLYEDRQDGLHGLLIHHFRLAGEFDKAVQYSRLAAGQALQVYAYDEAAQNLRAALEMMGPDDASERIMLTLEELGDVCSLVRDFEVAVSYYQKALSIWEGIENGDIVVFVRLHRKIIEIATDTKWSVDSETYQEVSQISQVSKAVIGANLTKMVEGPPHAETVRLLAALSADAWRVQEPSDWEAAQNYAQEAVTMAEHLGDATLLSQALGVLASVLDGRSLLRQHLQVAQQRLNLTQGEDFKDARERIDALRGMGVAKMYVGEYGEALPFLDEAGKLAGRIKAADQITNALGITAQCYYRMDRWDDVLEIEKQWRELEQIYPRERIGETCFFVALSASVHALRGDGGTAEGYARESFEYMVMMSGQPDHWQRNQFY